MKIRAFSGAYQNFFVDGSPNFPINTKSQSNSDIGYCNISEKEHSLSFFARRTFSFILCSFELILRFLGMLFHDIMAVFSNDSHFCIYWHDN